MTPLIHIGYHKTATSWMQRELFLPKHGYCQLITQEEAEDYITGAHDLNFDAQKTIDHLKAQTDKIEDGSVPMVSSEMIVGHPFFAARESLSYANRIKTIAPDANILVTIRSQKTMLPSVYMQYISRGGTMKPEQFFNLKSLHSYHRFDHQHFFYDRLVGLYQKLFKNVLVVTQESLRTDPQGTLQRLADFSGNKVKPSLDVKQSRRHGVSPPEFAVPLLRRINHVRTSTLNPSPVISLGHEPGVLYLAAAKLSLTKAAKTICGDRKYITELVERDLAPLYEQSNERLSKMVGYDIDLSKYPLP